MTSFSFHKKSVTWPQDHFQAEKHIFPEANLWAQVPTLKDSRAFPSKCNTSQVLLRKPLLLQRDPTCCFLLCIWPGQWTSTGQAFKSKCTVMAGFRMSLTFPVLKWHKLLKYCFLSCTANKNRASYSKSWLRNLNIRTWHRGVLRGEEKDVADNLLMLRNSPSEEASCTPECLRTGLSPLLFPQE